MNAEAPLISSVGAQISAGSPAPAVCRRVITVVGMSCRLALSNTSSMARARSPCGPREDRRLAASIPAGVAALPSPSRFAARFIDMALQACSSFKPGNKGFNTLRNSLPSRFTSPVEERISSRPLHRVMVARSVTSSSTALPPLSRSAWAQTPLRPVRTETTADARTATTQILPTFSPALHRNPVK